MEVVVGSEDSGRKSFYLREDRLCDISVFFEEKLKGRFRQWTPTAMRDFLPSSREQQARPLSFPHYRVPVFELFVQWLNHTPLSTPTEKNANDYIDLYIMAEHLGAESLMNTSIDLIKKADHDQAWSWREWPLATLRRVYDTDKGKGVFAEMFGACRLIYSNENSSRLPLPHCDNFSLIYDPDKSTRSGLRRFVLRSWVIAKGDNYWVDELKIEDDLPDGCLKADLLLAFRAYGKGELDSPRDEPSCKFHEHKRTEKCGGKKEARK